MHAGAQLHVADLPWDARHGGLTLLRAVCCVLRIQAFAVVSCGRMQDGRNWARIEADHHTHALFDRGEAGEWDALFAGSPQVLAAGPRDMRLWYHSFDAAQQRFRVGLATSEDGFKCATPHAVTHVMPAPC